MKKQNRTHRNKTNSDSRAKLPTYIITAAVIVLSGIIAFFISDGNEFIWDDPAAFSEESALTIDENTLRVHFIDVGQGDCALLQTKNEAILIDAGGDNNYHVADHIKSLGIDTLNYVIATHPHADHINYLDEVIDSFSVLNVILPKLTKENTPTTSSYESLLRAVKNSGAKTISAKPGASYSVGDIEMTVLAPIKQTDDLNDMSVVVSIRYGNTSFLFMGDAEKFSENLILESEYAYLLDADVLKVGHHGSRGSTGKKFLSAVSPEIAVIPCASHNDYGHPHEETVQLLNDYGIEILKTSSLGTFVIESDGEKLSNYRWNFNATDYR